MKHTPPGPSENVDRQRGWWCMFDLNIWQSFRNLLVFKRQSWIASTTPEFDNCFKYFLPDSLELEKRLFALNVANFIMNPELTLLSWGAPICSSGTWSHPCTLPRKCPDAVAISSHGWLGGSWISKIQNNSNLPAVETAFSLILEPISEADRFLLETSVANWPWVFDDCVSWSVDNNFLYYNGFIQTNTYCEHTLCFPAKSHKQQGTRKTAWSRGQLVGLYGGWGPLLFVFIERG